MRSAGRSNCPPIFGRPVYPPSFVRTRNLRRFGALDPQILLVFEPMLSSYASTTTLVIQDLVHLLFLCVGPSAAKSDEIFRWMNEMCAEVLVRR